MKQLSKPQFDIQHAYYISTIKTEILGVISSLSTDALYSKESAIADLSEVVRELHERELLDKDR
ncbi:hypothetical protein [Brevibacillus reuszeri]|uniref:hypothetical protein n=1 Tax=Brevibacillus reuszeri TaxID=54915 RepID=UPI000CCC012C|nr:hypothetical protein [Brevibacillus reuszeri]